jgi:hypothetical protein
MRRAALVALAVGGAAVGCASVLGIPDVTLEDGGGADASVLDASMPPHDGNAPPAVDGAEAATHDAGPADAADSSPPPVDASDACVPVAKSVWCINRCGTVPDSCNVGGMMDCGGCADGGVCNNGACNCNPDSLTKTCMSLACGAATNNCQQSVVCPNTCTPADLCGAGGAGPNACCSPNDVAACSGKACGPATNNCGENITCTDTCVPSTLCGAGGVGPNTCCSPNDVAACSGKACGPAVDNCGLNVTCTDTCSPPSLCGAGGVGANQCCAPNGMACNGKACGSATDNCGEAVACTNTCVPPGLCGIGTAGPNQCCAATCAGKVCGQSDGCLSTCNTNNGCTPPKSCGGTSCVNDGSCSGGTHMLPDCQGTPATWLFWNCTTKPLNLGTCTQVDQAMFAYAYCCPP